MKIQSRVTAQLRRSHATVTFFLISAFIFGCDQGGESEDTVAAREETVTSLNKSDELANGKPNRGQKIENVEKLLEDNRVSEAARILQELLLLDPSDTEVVFRYATTKAAVGEYAEAIELLEGIPIEHPEAGLPAIGQSADWCMASGKFAKAEQKYMSFLNRVPGSTMAHRKLAYLLNRQGRRHEAAEHIKELCLAGDVQESELHTLMSLSDAVYDDPDATNQTAQKSERMYWPIGASGEARKLFTDQNYAAAAKLMSDEVSATNVPASVNAFYGRTLVEAQEEAAFLQWLRNADEDTKRCAEYWAAVGAYLLENQRFEEAVRALGEALRLDATDARSMRRIHQALKALKKDDAAKACFDYYVTMRDVTLASNRIGQTEAPSQEVFTSIIQGLRKLGRPLEAVIWETVAAFYANQTRDALTQIAKRRSVLAQSPDRFPSDVVESFGIPLKSYPLPKWEEIELGSRIASQTKLAPASEAKFENIAKQVGLDHSYYVGETIQGSQYSIYQSVGGGVGVIDFDLDGFPDLYFAQGSGTPPTYAGDKSNALFRTVDGRMINFTREANALEHQYSTGIAVGDWNQDGFPDIAIANIGGNRLLVNNGDGTFSSSPTDPIDNRHWMSTSLAFGDVTGDAIPDLVELIYADDETLAKKPEREDSGLIVMVGPHDFKPARDRLLVNDGSGEAVARDLSVTAERATGLGLVIADFDNQPGNEIFIGNDLYADQLFRRDAEGVLQDTATLLGCAFAANGARTATMGIAASDFDNSGTLDLHLTNFEKESATLYLNRGKTFQDRARQFKLNDASFPVVGFGCQAIDYDNNGLMDIVVTNGHVENIGDTNSPFSQPHQLFANRGNQFSLMNADDPSGYFSAKHVGRALATLDYNRDGKQDYVVTHIEAESALLINRTKSPHHWLRVRLVGTESERDAVGARVKIETDSFTSVHWVTGGDGYLCRNEQALLVGLGESESIKRLTVTWPSGKTSRFSAINSDQSILVTENAEKVFIEKDEVL